MNHLKTVLLQQQGSGHIDPEFNHYQESLELLKTLVANQVDPVLIALLRDFLAQMDSNATIGFPGIGSTAKELAFLALTDSQLTCSLLMPGLCSSNPEIINLAIDLYWAVVKKQVDRAQLDPRLTNALLPLIIKHAKTNPKAKTVLDSLYKKLRLSRLSQTFISIFSKDKKVRAQAYSQIFKLEFFDTCLNFTLPTGAALEAIAPLPGNQKAAHTFTDPLEGIVDDQGRIAFIEKLAALPDKSMQRGRITQAQIKSLYELLSISLNSQLEFNVRGVALDQIAEALFFYRDSHTLKDFCEKLLNVCKDNLNEFGSKRENFSMLLANLRPLDESFISSKSAGDLPLQNKYYEQEKTLAARFLAAYNGVIHHFNHLGETRTRELESLFTQEKNKGLCRSLWILATETDRAHRFQAFLLLNLVFVSGVSIISMLESDVLDKTLALKEKDAGCFPILSAISSEFHILYRGVEVVPIESQHPLANINSQKHSSILEFIEAFTELSSSPENKHLGFGPEVNKDKIIGLLADNRLTRCLQAYSRSMKADGQLSSLIQWSTVALLASFMDRTEFFEQRAVLDATFAQMRELLSQGKDELFLEYNSCLQGVLKSRIFKGLYSIFAPLRTFLLTVTDFYHSKLLPLVYELHVEAFAEKHDLILGILSFMTTTVRLAMGSNDQKLLVLIRGFITKPAFLEFLSDILRKYEAMDIVSTSLVEFMRWHYDLFLRSDGEKRFFDCVQFMFDSSLICTRTDNFIGSRRLLDVLKLAHNMATRNLLLTAGDTKPLFEDVKQMKKEDIPMPLAFKSTTIAWIVSLLDHRSIAVRMLCWNLIANYFDASLLEMFPSLVDNAISTLNLVNEASGVLSLCYFFLFKCGRLISTLDCIEVNDRPLSRTVSKDEFIRKLHDRKAIETVRRIIAQEDCPPMLLANCLRFTIEWFSLDPHSIVNKYFHSDFLDKLSLHLGGIESLDANDHSPENIKRLTEKLSSMNLILNFLIVTTRGNSSNSKVLLVNFSYIEVILSWLSLCGRVLKEPINLQGDFHGDKSTSIHQKILQGSVVELAKNGIHLLEVLIYEDKETFIRQLEEHEDENPQDQRLFSVIAELMTHDTSSASLGYRLLKLASKVLLSWNRGYQILDRDESASYIAECLAARCMQFFKSIDYLKISDSDYLKIIGSEEIIHVLAVISAKSDRVKEKFLQSGLFQLYVSKFLQIIRSFKRDINYITVNNKKESMVKSTKSQTSQMRSLTSSEVTKKSSAKDSKPRDEGKLATKTSKLNENIRQITENSSGHIKAYILVAKYFFHNPAKSATLQKQTSDLLEERIGDLMEIVNFLWIEGQADDVDRANLGNPGGPARAAHQLAHELPLQRVSVQAPDRSEVHTADRHPRESGQVSCGNKIRFEARKPRHVLVVHYVHYGQCSGQIDHLPVESAQRLQ